jgi:hypothetical protein
MARFRKKPVIIDALRFTGSPENEQELRLFIDPDKKPFMSTDRKKMAFSTLEGVMIASAGDWIIRGVAGEFYPCKDSIFQATYEPVEE